MTAVVLRGDARALPLPDASVDLVVTSPPYFGLRSYTDDGEHYDGQIGSEATPAEWLAAMLGCTREWMRVLKPSGSIFVNLGDKYSTGAGGGADLVERGHSNGGSNPHRIATRPVAGYKPKSLLGLPWRYAIGCTDQLGLILRRDIIWSKPNGLPESVTDRCRSSHEYLFHLVKQPRYYAAVDEIREPHTGHRGNDAKPARSSNGGLNHRALARDESLFNPLGKLPGSVWSIPSQPLTVPAALGVDHFAAFPMELPRRCVLGWSPPGICTACGEGRRPVIDRKPMPEAQKMVAHRRPREGPARDGNHGPGRSDTEYNVNGRDFNRWRAANPETVTGYACACSQDVPLPGRDVTADGSTVTTCREPAEDRAGQGHLPPTRPALVVDPFGGTGTTALVAAAYGRTGVSVDLSGDYCRLARWRTADPAERAKALEVPRPPPVPDGQASLFDDWEAV